MRNRAALQSVFNHFMPAYRHTHRLTPDQARVCAHISQCRTEALGGWHWACTQCDYARPRYHSCRDRHCPQCQSQASAQWCERQQHATLPVPYFHLVFTLPHGLNAWVSLHPDLIYRLLFETVWATLKAFGADTKRLGGELGMSAVLHTWGQNLSRHVHLHCLVPGGVFTADGQWRGVKGQYLFPVKALARHFRGRMVGALRQAYQNAELGRVTHPGEVDRRLDELMQTDWVVYTKAYVTQTDTVVRYLARYSHRIALSDRRIVGIEGEHVDLRYKDYRDGHHKVMRLRGEELIRRFLLHVLPKGFMRIRHFGFLANRCRQRKLAQIRALLLNEPAPCGADSACTAPPLPAPSLCPKCRTGQLRVRCLIMPIRFNSG